MRTFLLEEETPSMLAGRAEGQRYHQAVINKEAGAQKPEAPPHVYIGLAVIKRLLGHHSPMEMSSLHEEDKKELEKYLADLESADTQMAVTLLPYLKINKTYTEGYRLRCTCQTEAQSASLAWFLLRVEDAQEKKGKAPKGKIARKLAKLLVEK